MMSGLKPEVIGARSKRRFDPSRTLSPRWTPPIVDDKIQIAAGKIAFSKFLRLVMSRVVAVILCLVALTQVYAKAEEWRRSKDKSDALDKSAGGTYAMLGCITEHMEVQSK